MNVNCTKLHSINYRERKEIKKFSLVDNQDVAELMLKMQMNKKEDWHHIDKFRLLTTFID